MFTESTWYRDLIEKHRGPENLAPIVLWPYPIDPAPGGPLSAEYDLLVYAKSGYSEELIAEMRTWYRRSVVVRYGTYRREDLYAAARRSRACVYLSDDDRGPLALAEILLSGCPAIGIPTGAPFVEHNRTGVVLDRLHQQECRAAADRCHELERRAVAARAAECFDTGRIVGTVLKALRTLALSGV